LCNIHTNHPCTINLKTWTGAGAVRAAVLLDLTEPDGSHATKTARTNRGGLALARFALAGSGTYQARVTSATIRGFTFAPSPADLSNELLVSP
jgi:hypothetical protein